MKSLPLSVHENSNSNSALMTQLRKKALDALRESSELLEQAFGLLQDGNPQEAEKMNELALESRRVNDTNEGSK
jgi:hypothetical protein